MLGWASCAAALMALDCNFEVSACGQFVEVMSRNIGMDIKRFSHLCGGDTLFGFARKQIHGAACWVAECRCDGGHGGSE
jgi:hypothetical protein